MQIMLVMLVMLVMLGIVTFARQVVSPARADPEACRQTGKKTTGDSYADPTR
ncbi:hypothetical protein ABEI33_12525 [Pantoea agglomerans]|uniref:hypothetical protein n=1 Tax=Enterobacter agglomerans TaxID=549 RepID=UPI0016548CEB|nr:hypothetical protein [Pantoea agglomerans]